MEIVYSLCRRSNLGQTMPFEEKHDSSGEVVNFDSAPAHLSYCL